MLLLTTKNTKYTNDGHLSLIATTLAPELAERLDSFLGGGDPREVSIIDSVFSCPSCVSWLKQLLLLQVRERLPFTLHTFAAVCISPRA